MADGLGDNFAAGFGSNWALPPGFDPNEWLRRMQLQPGLQPGILPQTAALPAPAGQQQPGNINLLQRPQVQTPEGTATVRSMGVNLDGQETLLPTVSNDGRIMSPDEAIAEFQRSGQHLGKFDTPANADAAGQAIHQQQAQLYPERTPAEAAAASVRRSVQPPGGRAEGAATRGIEFPAKFVGALAQNKANLQQNYPERALQAAAKPFRAARGFTEAGANTEQFPLQTMQPGEQRTISTDYDPRQRAADLGAETALNVTLAPGASAPAGALTMGARRRRPPAGGGRPPGGEQPPPPIGGNMPPGEPLPIERTTGEQLAGSVRKGRAPAITAVSLRDKPLEEAARIASTEQHLIPQPSGGFSGGPRNVRNRQDLEKMRADFDEAVRLGASVGADQWYKLARGLVADMAPNNPIAQREAARALGLFSAQATPETNLGFMLQAKNAYEAGTPASRVRTGAQAEKYNVSRATGTDIPLGKKTEVYGQNLDPNQPWTTTGTNDIWHARAMGFTNPSGKPWDAALTPQNHAFLDAETVLAVKRMNDAKVGGRSDWTAPEIQAASWVGRRAQSMAGKKRTPDMASALAEAATGYTESVPKHTIYGTAEATPGVGTGHLQGVATGPSDLRERFAADPRSTYSPGGVDVYHQAVGLGRAGETLPMTGIYQGPQGREVNPGWASRSLGSLAGPSGARTIDQPTNTLMSAAEALKAYVGAQNAGAYSQLFPKNKAGRLTSYQFPTGGQWTPEQVRAIEGVTGSWGLPNVVHLGDKAVATNFGAAGAPGLPKGMTTGEQTGMRYEMSKLGFDPTKSERTEFQGNMVDFGKQWKKGEGSGAATRKLMTYFSPEMIAKVDQHPLVKRHIAGLIARDAEFSAAGGGPLRQDLVNAQKIIQMDGLAGLKRALAAGAVSLPAIAVLARVLPDALGLQQPAAGDQGM